MKIALIGCSKEKLNGTMAAKDKYMASTLYSKSRMHAEKTTDGFYILSAKYGLLKPDDLIEDYNLSLANMTANKRKEWAAEVIAQLWEVLEPTDEVVIYAGKLYYEYILEDLFKIVKHVEIRMKGKKHGERLQWLTEQIQSLTSASHQASEST